MQIHDYTIISPNTNQKICIFVSDGYLFGLKGNSQWYDQNQINYFNCKNVNFVNKFQEDICELWEVLWTGLPCINFHLFVSVAILDDQQNTFIDQKYEFNEILKHVNDLSLAIDLKSTLEKAEAIYLQIKVTEHLTDEIRLIIGEEPIRRTEIVEEEYDDNFDEIVTISKNAKEEIEIQKKIDEACERSMYNSFY